MNKKAELFQAYLQEKNITCFEVQEVPEDQLNTVVFRSVIQVEGQELPTLVVLDSSIYTMIRVRVANAALKEGNELELTKAINKINAQYKVFKYYFAEDGALILDCCVTDPVGTVDCDMIWEVLIKQVILQHVLTEYKNIMKLIWA